MKFVIVGCGRVGAALAEAFDNAGHAIRGDGTDEDVLRRAGAEGADVLLALTEGDNRNVMAAQVAAERLSVGKIVAKINDPVRAAAYAELGIATVCRTTMLTDAILGFLSLGPTGMPSVISAVPHVHDADAGAQSSGPPRLGAQALSTARREA